MIPLVSSVLETVSNVVSGTVGKFIEDKDKAKELETALMLRSLSLWRKPKASHGCSETGVRSS